VYEFVDAPPRDLATAPTSDLPFEKGVLLLHYSNLDGEDDVLVVDMVGYGMVPYNTLQYRSC